MKKYPLYTELDLVDLAHSVSKEWREKNTFLASLEKNKTPLYFYEGPPGANGRPGIHHLFARTLKDLFCRYNTMQGYRVERRAGWDTHGLPVELAVEKELGITKEQVGKKISLLDYNKACKATVLRHQKEWEELTERIGYWIDLRDPYLTYEASYIEIVWGLLQRLYEKKLLYQGYSIQPYSPAAGTGLSSHELNQPGCYKEVKDLSIVAQFKVKHLPNTYLLAWTTTPWTLPANTALALGKGIDYVSIQTYNPYTHKPIEVVLAGSALPRYFDPKQKDQPLTRPTEKGKPLPWRIKKHYKGEDLIGWAYEQLLPYVSPPKSQSVFQVVDADFVTTKEGTGIIHIAPTFGADDFLLAQKLGLPSITVYQNGKKMPIVDLKGRFVRAITDFSSQYVRPEYAPDQVRKKSTYQSVDLQIAIKLKAENKAFRVAPYVHSYPHCWRTGKPILYYPLKAWFVRTTAYKKKLIEKNETIQWQPSSTGQGRFAKWLENLVDWNLSRSRFWGTPLPIWRTEDGKEEKCIGNFQELRHQVSKSIVAGYMSKHLPHDFDPHRPYVDEIILVSPTGKKMYREPDVIDVWFDSGAMPYAQNPQPYNFVTLSPSTFPAHFIIEGIDQTRGWFFTLHALAVLLYNRTAFRNVLATGLVLDKDGNKMSKQQGNTIDPTALLDQYGPDVIRWYFVVNANPWDNVKFDPNALQEVSRKFFATLHNTYQFFALYANLDGFQTKKKWPNRKNATALDLWILARLQHLIRTCTRAYEFYSPTPAARAIQQFVIDDLSNWYVRLNRKRFWQAGYTPDKETAYHTLQLCLSTIAQLAAPIAPFYMEKIYQDVHQKNEYTSVHLSSFPKVRPTYQHDTLERQMEYAKTIASLTHSLRKKHKIKVRIPLSRILIPLTKEIDQKDIEALTSIICTETNVQKLEFVSDTLGLVTKQLKPNFQRLGKTHGRYLQKIKEALSALSQEEINAFEKKGTYVLQLTDQTIHLDLEDVLITTQDMQGWAIARQEPITIALDLTLTPALIAEGYARELVNRIQNLRKEKNFAIDDKITLHIHTYSQPLQKAIEAHRTYIMQETQAHVLDTQIASQCVTTLDIDDHIVKVSIRVVAKVPKEFFSKKGLF